jgi:hypothetical protein
MSDYEIELLNTALDDYVRNIYINILDYKLGEHYCYLERNLMYVILERSLDKTLKKQEEYMKSLKQV